MRRDYIFLGIIIALCFVIVFLLRAEFSASSQKTVSQTIPTVLNVPVQKIRLQPILFQKEYIGTVIPIHSVQIRPFISGFIDRVFVKGGEKVKAGDQLFILQQASYKAARETALANVMKAKADLKNAQTYLDRIKKTKSSAISKTELDNARTQYLSAMAAFKSAEAGFKSASVNYDYTVIKSPIGGVIGNVSVTKGDYVSPEGSPLVDLVQYNPIRISFSVPNKDYLENMAKNKGSLWHDFQVKLILGDGSVYPFSGEHLFMNNQVSSETASVILYADFKNPRRQLLPNAYVTVVLEKKIPLGVLIDQNLVSFEPDGTFVYLIKNGIIAKQKVVVSQSIGHQFYISNGLKNDDLVISEPVSQQMIGHPAQGQIQTAL